MPYQMPGTMLNRPMSQVGGAQAPASGSARSNPLYRQPTAYSPTRAGAMSGPPNSGPQTVPGQPHPSTYNYQTPQGPTTPSQSQQVAQNYANNQYSPQMNQGLGGGGGGYKPGAMQKGSASPDSPQGSILQEYGKAIGGAGENIYNHISEDWGNGDNWGWEMAKDIGSDLWGGIKDIGMATYNDPIGALSGIAAIASDGATLSLPGGKSFLQSPTAGQQQQAPQYQARKYHGGYARGGRVKTPKEMAHELMGMGRDGDTMLAHINPIEAAFLKAMGGRGSINPKTGLREYPPKTSRGASIPVSRGKPHNSQSPRRK